MAKMITGLKPRNFVWVIADRLAVSERIGGNGFQHRRVRRDEEITWLIEEARITGVVSLLPGNQNISAYTEAGLAAFPVPIQGEIERDDCAPIHAAIDEALSSPQSRALIHREIVDDALGGVLAGYLLHAGLLDDSVLAIAVVQEILGRPLGPEGRALVPPAGG